MTNIERKKNSFKPLVFNIDLSANGKVMADISDIFFVIKRKVSDDDDDALMLKNMSDGITVSGMQVIVPWTNEEYDAFSIGETYSLGLFLKFTGDPVADEDIAESFSITIIQDFLHDQ